MSTIVLPHKEERLKDFSGRMHKKSVEATTGIDAVPLIGSVQPFPLDALPGCLVPMVTEGAKANYCPPEFIAIPALATLGLAIGNSRTLKIKEGWTFKSNLYAAVVAPPGSAKSPAQALAIAPLKELQKKKALEYQAAMEEYAKDMAEWELKCELAKKEGKVKPAKPEPPVMEELYTTDITTEALAQTLERNYRGMIIVFDELTGWVNGLNQYKGGKGTDREYYLSFWNGVPTKVNRTKREPLFLSDPFLSVVGAMPPAVLNQLVDEKGRGEDGFIHRILFSYPDPVPQQWTEETVSEHARNLYDKTFFALRELKPNPDGSPQVITLADEAYSLWIDCYNQIQTERDALDFPENLQGVWAKMPSQAARLSLIIHCCRLVTKETSSEKVDHKSMAMAWLLTDYFRSHARRVYQQLREDPEDRKIRQVLEWIKKYAPGGVTTRELIAARKFRTSDEARTMLETMRKRELGYFIEESGATRGPKKQIFVLYS